MTPEIQIQLSPSSSAAAAAAASSAAAASAAVAMPEPLHESIPLRKTTAGSSNKNKNKLALLPLVFLIYFEVSGGPYGSEQTVLAGGPLLAILGFVLFPFVWSIPEALITAELATALPGNGGYVVWADRAFGPFSGSLMGSWKFLSGAINSAAYPALCADYIARVVPTVSSGGPRVAAIAAATVLLSFLNYTGLTVVGYTAMALCAASLSPFFVMAAAALPKLHPRRWGAVAHDRDWRLFFNTLFWNLNFWDNASTLAGEVDRPQRTFPRALLAAGLLTSAAYLVPLFTGTAALDEPYSSWGSGFYADAAGMIAGRWLKYWVEVGAVLSAIGLYEAQLSSAAFQLLGMADLGFLPKPFALRSKWFNTPWVGIVTSSLISLGISFLSLDDIISSANFLYSLGMLLEIASFLWLRRKQPNLKRPFRVPLRMPALIFMCFVPSAFLIYVMVLANWRVFAISGGLTLFGGAMYFFMEFCKARGFLKFKLEERMGEMEEQEGNKDEA
ncbi:putative polyamine transporter [Apostasia shenzhenica]|uniref:Polyamine transporter PUT1 n=1 Tax=Apostasia shenzhenica TaxID=1088818 RepID=A0A2I0ADG3_9ASPA|nr:putative polyamine transporter [Apostasia shenzhenica]